MATVSRWAAEAGRRSSRKAGGSASTGKARAGSARAYFCSMASSKAGSARKASRARRRSESLPRGAMGGFIPLLVPSLCQRAAGPRPVQARRPRRRNVLSTLRITAAREPPFASRSGSRLYPRSSADAAVRGSRAAAVTSWRMSVSTAPPFCRRLVMGCLIRSAFSRVNRITTYLTTRLAEHNMPLRVCHGNPIVVSLGAGAGQHMRLDSVISWRKESPGCNGSWPRSSPAECPIEHGVLGR